MSQVNAAVIGAGAIGHSHIQDFQSHPDCKVVAVVDTSEERAKVAAAKFGVAEVFTDHKALLDRDDIQVVSAGLPNYLHAPIGLDLLQAGKHLVMEKPFATSYADAKAMADAAEKAGVQLMVGQNQRFTATSQTLKQMVARGDLGDVYQARGVWLRRAGIPRIGSWFTQKKFAGGGCVYDIGVHMLDLGLFMLDEFDVVGVSATVSANFGPRGEGEGGWGKSEVDPAKPFDVDDNAVAFLRLKSGRSYLLEVSWARHQPTRDENGLTILGNKAAATSNPMRLFQAGDEGYQSIEVPNLPPLCDKSRMAHFVDVVLNRAEPFVPLEQSLKVQRILDAVYQSAEEGREIRLDG